MSTQRPGLTPYNYCQNNPLLRIDPTGMLDENWVTSTIAGVQGRMGMNNIIDGTTVTVNGDDEKKTAKNKPSESNTFVIGLTAVGSTTVTAGTYIFGGLLGLMTIGLTGDNDPRQSARMEARSAGQIMDDIME